MSVAAGTRTVSERLAAHVASLRFDDLPDAVVERTKDLLVHQLSLAFTARGTEPARHALAVVRELDPGAGTSTIVGHREKAPLLDAIFAHTVLTTSSLDDFQFPSGLHLGRAVHSVGWVLGERERTPGRDLIAAVVASYDVACKLALPELLRSYIRRPQHAFEPLATTAIAARLLRLDAPSTGRALANAAHIGMGIVEGQEGPATSALMARDSVIIALLARTARTASADESADNGSSTLRTIEGPYGLYKAFFGYVPEGLEPNLASLGRDFAILGASTKRYPSSASHFTALDRTSALVRENGLRARDVSRCQVTLAEDFRGRFTYMEGPIDGPDPSDAEILRSLRLKLAILLVDGAIDPQPTRARFREPAVQALLPAVTLDYEARRSLDFARVAITTKDGRTLRTEGGFTPYPKGDWSEWLRRDGERFLSGSRLAQLERLLTHLEDVDDVGEVLAATVSDRD